MFPDANVEGPDSIHWLYNTMSNLYGDWLPGEEQQQTIKDGGYYSVGYIFTTIKKYTSVFYFILLLLIYQVIW